MTLLLDSHVALWSLASPARLGPICRARLETEEIVLFSPVTPWELGIKAALGKISVPEGLADELRSAGFAELPITSEHAAAAAVLPPIHRDPFDRMLIAQANRAGATLITADRAITDYEIPFLDARS